MLLQDRCLPAKPLNKTGSAKPHFKLLACFLVSRSQSVHDKISRLVEPQNQQYKCHTCLPFEHIPWKGTIELTLLQNLTFLIFNSNIRSNFV